MWINVAEAHKTTDDNITRSMRFECWITKATNTHPEHAILWILLKHALVLRCTHTACLVNLLAPEIYI